MAALSSGIVTLTLVLLLLSIQTNAWRSTHGKTQNQHTKAAAKLKYANTHSGYSSIANYQSSMVVPRPPTLNAGPSYLPQPPVPIIANPVPISHPPASQGGAAISEMAQNFVDEHNKVRNVYGVPQLTWNPQLIPSAHRLAAACAFRHTDNNPYGENIAAGQTSPQEVVSQWVEGPEEKLAWNPKNPQDSHFTQVVWEATRELGCAVTSCPTMVGVSLPQSPIQFWVCEYNPSGNVETLYLKNVHALAGGKPSRR
ncbi:hypothetical protein PTTG_06314 [Puccinia triticina 1-1 BBBD Race 1]|uniref:SCP domain-containing protein n=2 Tax=Puccinia triticina TaxID=208348 RepID=A0A0C4EZQ4_PUCT1|nr:uncharacterized protein PtA15_3A155 [Puccinia triticina]OAV96315.1 hypothetical protein PTTG_06314 [Puccinia triticina 1-1 BBBD Race 1]WAQ82791.1 hypothetical protein PtA15_3A155 [Puccinia triticina]WAR53632.1 hypothetical protein PtB15_3B140 [Puccinia triticina]